VEGGRSELRGQIEAVRGKTLKIRGVLQKSADKTGSNLCNLPSYL